MCLKLTKAWRRSAFFVVEHISYVFVMFLLLTSNKYYLGYFYPLYPGVCVWGGGGILCIYAFKGTLMQIQKCSHTFVFIWKWYPENFVFLILRIFELFTRKICEMFIYMHTKTIEYFKN